MKIRSLVFQMLGFSPAREQELLKKLVKEQESSNESLKELVEVLQSSNSSVFWTPVKLVILSSLISLIITMISVFLVVDETQKNDEEQEKLAVLRLLTVSELDVKKAIDEIDRIGEAELNTDDSQGCIISHWSDPNATSAYPTIFADVITDRRVILSLSEANVQSLYSYKTKLESSLDDIKHMSYDHPLNEAKYADYRDKLKILQLTLSEEIRYQKGELSETQLAKASQNFKSEARTDSPFENHYDFNSTSGNGGLQKQ